MKEEILNGVTEELMVPEYISVSWLTQQPEVVYRLDRAGHRYYYTIDEGGNPSFFVSVTTLIRQTLPTSPHLIKWIADMGSEESKEYAEEKANYGTFLHIQCGHLLINAKYDLDKVRDYLMDYIEDHHLPMSFMQYEEELKKDILAFAQFIIDYKVVPIAVELVLTHKEYGVAGAIDLVCEMDYEESGYFGEVYRTGPQKGKPKLSKQTRRIVAIVDLKSGKKGFYESSEIQLHCYKDMFESNFPAIKIDRVFNWSPKEWRGHTPSFNLKDQTGSKSAKKLPYLVALAKIEDEKKNNSITITHGEIDLAKGLYSNVESIDLDDIIKKRHDHAL
jgi:hypothetical protein